MTTDYFYRQLQMWSAKEQEALAQKRIAIIGCGGLGCSVGIALSGLGLGEIFVVDFDQVELHNIHRQIAFCVDDEGKYKAQVLADLINERSILTKAVAITKGMAEFKNMGIEVDLIIDATDNLFARKEINAYAKACQTPWIHGSVEAFRGQVAFFANASFDEVFHIGKLEPVGIAAPMVMHIASLQANLATRYLVGWEIKKDVLHYIDFDDKGIYTHKQFDLA